MEKEYILLDVLGKSRFTNTSMYLAKHKITNSLNVVKLTELDDASSDKVAFIQKELLICKTLFHKNILIHDQSFTVGSKLYVIIELMRFGSCSDLIDSNFKCGLPEAAIAFILQSVLKGLSYLHYLGLIHRGIKASHIFISDNNVVKLGGNRNLISTINAVGKSKTIYDYPKHATTSLPWLSPEILQQNMEGYQTQSDIYSLGITACELANGYAPFTDMSNTQMLYEKLRGTRPCLLDKTTIPQSTVIHLQDNEHLDEIQRDHITRQERLFSSLFHQFVLQCLQRHAFQRPTTNRLLSHQFFEQASNIDLTKMLLPLIPISIEAINLQDTNDEDVVDLTTETSKLNIAEWDFEISIAS